MNRILQLRKELKLNQKELADKVGVSQTAVSQWELGKTEPNAETTFDLCGVFDVSFEFLLGRSEIRGRFNLTDEEEQQLALCHIYDMNRAHFEAYQKLDQHGKDVVDAITMLELERVKHENNPKP
jgi:transcriptional regulator with XRE-family HTH domain